MLARVPGSWRTLAMRCGVACKRCVTLSPAIIRGPPYSKTIAAASGSAQMLNSATDVRFPKVPPPISEMPAIFPARSGARRSARAMFVSGPVGTSQTPSVVRQVSIM